MSAFQIGKMSTEMSGDPEPFRKAFNRDCHLMFEQPFAPDMLEMLLRRAAAAPFVGDHVVDLGDREVEQQQAVGGTISLLLGREPFCHWLSQATGKSPIRAAAGKLAQMCAGAKQSLDWHDDLDDRTRQLAVVINLSDQPFSGGDFEMRHVGSDEPFLSHHYTKPGAMTIFDVRGNLEHRVTEVTSGGPRRVYAGWFLSEPEHAERSV